MSGNNNKSGPARRRNHYSYRSMQRSRSHASATADAQEEALPPVPEHAWISADEPALVTTAAGLAELAAHARREGSFAYDTEFIGEMSYFPLLCLIQVATTKRVALVDPIAAPELDLRPFWELIADASVEKVVHAGLQDLEPVVRHLGKPPVNVFDTQIAAGLAGHRYPVALRNLVLETTSATLGTGFKFTQWDRRPMSPGQMRYAADDVRYLPLLRQRIGEWLEKLGHTAWALQECAALSNLSLYRFDPDVQIRRMRTTSTLRPRTATILRELLIWRDRAAREQDLPVRSFLKDGVLVDLARSPLKMVDDLRQIRGLPRPVETAHGPAIVEIVCGARKLPPAPHAPSAPRRDEPQERAQIDVLWGQIEQACAARSIDLALAASRREVAEICRAALRGRIPPRNRLLHGWRHQLLGPLIEQFLQDRGVAHTPIPPPQLEEASPDGPESPGLETPPTRASV